MRAWRAAEGARLDRQALALSQAADRLQAAWPRLVEARAQAVLRLGGLLDSYSYEQVLARGFALVRDADGQPVTTADAARAGDHWTIAFQGQASVAVMVEEGRSAPKRETRRSSGKGGDVRQGTLL
jgi:exodeoxyribonuclease VII large subunit